MLLLGLSLLGMATALPTSSQIASETPLPVGYYSSGEPGGVRSFSTAGFKDATTGISRGGHSVCVSGILEVEAMTTHNAKLSEDMIPKNQTELVAMLLKMFTPPMIKGNPEFTTVQQTFNVGASLCGPANATSAPDTVELLTHGTGFDRFYWDFAPGYSYVDAATAAGHVVLMYDRLGNGATDHPDPLIVQTPIQLELAHSLVSMLRNGSIGDNKFKNVVGVGHSFGSGITQALNVHYPTLLDASVFTGFGVSSTNTTTIGFDLGGNPTIASLADPYRFGDLPNGYMVPQSAEGNQIQFFSFPGFDPTILTQVNAQKGLQAVGELFSPMVGGPAMNYSKPVAIVNGDHDWPYCQGNCSYPTNQLELVKPKLYSGLDAGKFSTFLAPNAGHGLNLHYSANQAYSWIQKFLKDQGL